MTSTPAARQDSRAVVGVLERLLSLFPRTFHLLPTFGTMSSISEGGCARQETGKISSGRIKLIIGASHPENEE